MKLLLRSIQKKIGSQLIKKLRDKDWVLTRLLKKFLEVALDDEFEVHIENED